MLAELKKLWTELGAEIKTLEAKLGVDVKTDVTALEADAKRDALKDLTPTASAGSAPVVAPIPVNMTYPTGTEPASPTAPTAGTSAS